MSIRATVTLEDDVVERLKRESRSRSSSFRDTLNDLLRMALLQSGKCAPKRKLEIEHVQMGYRPAMRHWLRLPQ